MDENNPEVEASESAPETESLSPQTQDAPETPPEKPAKPEALTLAKTGGTDKLTPVAPSTWPEDWRDRFAGADEDEKKRLKRFASPDSVYKSWRNLEKKLSSGNFKPVKPDTTNEAALAAWRKETGVPETPEGYYKEIPEIGADPLDKPALDYMFKGMHEDGVPAAQARNVIKKYYELQEHAAVQRLEQDAQFRGESEDHLRNEYGPQYRANLNAMGMLISEFGGKNLEEKLFGARTPDGRLLGDDPDVLKFLVDVSKAYYPDGTVTMTGTSDAAGYIDTIEREIQQLRAEMADTRPTDPMSYWKNPQKQARYQDLLKLKEKADARYKRDR